MTEHTLAIETEIQEHRWATLRWRGIKRNYKAVDVCKLRGTLAIEYTIAYAMATKLWRLIKEKEPVRALGAADGHQAIQMAQAGLKAIYGSGWQVAAGNNTARKIYPDRSLYPSNSVPELVQEINNALQRAEEIQHAEGSDAVDWRLPIVADAEAGFGSEVNAYALMIMMIEAGAAGVHFEDQLGSEKKCGHLGGKVLVPTGQFIEILNAARQAADVLNVPTVLIARTDAESATLLTSDIDERDKPFLTGERIQVKGYYRIKPGIEPCIARGLAYAPYADMLWMETKTPDLELAKKFADGIHKEFPDKLLAYNCSPSFNWKKHLSDEQIAKFQKELNEMGYKFQFVTLAGFHSLNHAMFKLAKGYAQNDMSAYVKLQEEEFESIKDGYQAVKHQRFVGTGYFDQISENISGKTATLAMKESTEADQFQKTIDPPPVDKK